jgi:hypothetical protein
MSQVSVTPAQVDEANMTIDNALKRADQLLDDLSRMMNQADTATMNSGSQEWNALRTQWFAFYTNEESKLLGVNVGSKNAIEAIRQGDAGAARAMA